jgi:Flp pilus assembly protein CpaB
VKKKSPPYAIIGAALLGIVAIFAFVKYKQGQDAAAAKAIADAQAQAKAAQDALTAAQNTPPPAAVSTNTRNVFYATQPVEAGAKISSAFYEKKATPVDILPDAFTDKDDIVGFYAVRPIEKGDPLTPRNIGKSLPQMSTRISPGMRALSLSIFNAEANNTGGFAVDGDMVDLLWTSTQSGLLDKTELVLQNVKILYIPGPKIESEQVAGVVPAGPPGDPITITFEVTPEQAQALVFLSQVEFKGEHGGGRFSMILRAKSDKSQIKIKSFDAEDYIGNFSKIQKTTDKSIVRVQALAAQIAAQVAAEQKAQAASQGTTNETPNPTPPTP